MFRLIASPNRLQSFCSLPVSSEFGLASDATGLSDEVGRPRSGRRVGTRPNTATASRGATGGRLDSAVGVAVTPKPLRSTCWPSVSGITVDEGINEELTARYNVL